MPNRYSNQYGTASSRAFTAGAEAQTQTISGAGSNAEKVGDAHRVVATYTVGASAPQSVLFSTADVLYVCSLPPKAKVQRIHISATADPASAQTRCNVGRPGAASVYASLLDLDAGTDDTVDIGALDAVASPNDWTDLIVTPTEAGLNQAAVLTFVVDYVIEKA
jgi:hypothetical protein